MEEKPRSSHLKKTKGCFESDKLETNQNKEGHGKLTVRRI